MSKIIKGYWKCESCGTVDIDGLLDECPNCGKRKPENLKYYMKETKEEVTEEELKKAGISKEECDGNHKEWVCSYCNQLNNYADETCKACGSPKMESRYEYSMGKKEESSKKNII